MKKVVIGCLGVLVIAAVAGGLAGYYFIYRPAKSYVSRFAQLQEIPDLNRAIRNTATFSPPATGELTPELVNRYVQAQQRLHDLLGARLQELDSKYRALSREQDGQPSLTDGLNALQDIAGLIVEAKRAQVQALNEFNFSLEEYDWARRMVYAASDMPLQVEWEGLIQQAGSGSPDFESLSETIAGPTPDANRRLVAPHADKLRERAALAFFGL